MLIDSHAHLDLSDFSEDLPEVLARAREAGVVTIVSVGIDLDSSQRAVALAGAHSMVFAAVGCHPHHADELGPDDLDRLTSLASAPRVVAWGEIGLDYFRNRSSRDGQLQTFERQLRIAYDLDLPVIIHDRDAHEDVLSCLRALGGQMPRGVIHCFSGDMDLARVFLDMGFYLSLPGTVTFPKAHTARDVAARIPLDRLLVETDSPYLTPVPHRGKRNEPAFVAYTAGEIARIRDVSVDEVAEQTSRNTQQLFGLPHSQPPESEGR